MQLTVNKEVLRAEVDRRGPLGKEVLAIETGFVTADQIAKMLLKEPRVPNRKARLAVSSKCGVPVSELFPEVKRRKSA